jgi:hypothetical protein
MIFAFRSVRHSDGLGVLALPLDVDGVVVKATGAIDLAGQHFGGGVDAGGLVLEGDIEPLLLVETQLFGQHEREIDLFVQAPDHDAHTGRR